MFRITVVGVDCWNKLAELLEEIKIVVNVSFVVTVHGWAMLAIRQEVAELKFEVEIRFFEVISFRDEPAFVMNDGFTVNDMELSVVFIQDILFASPWLPVRALMNVSGMAAEFEVTEPKIIGLAKLAYLSMLTVNVNIGFDGIYTRIVTVIVELSGINGNPVILTPY